MKKFKNLDFPKLREYYTKYPQGYSIYESLLDILNHINEVTDVVNLTLEKWGVIEIWVLEELQKYSINQLQTWISDGTLEEIINEVLLESKADKTELVALSTRVSQNEVNLTTLDTKVTKNEKRIDSLTLNVKDFGAIGNGTTDDTQAIKNAIAYAESLKNDETEERYAKGVTVFFPTGTYLLTDSLIIKKSGINLKGDSHSSTILYAPNCNFDVVIFDGSQKALYCSTINDIKIYTPHNTTSGTQLKMLKVINSINTNLELSAGFESLEINGCGKLYFNGININSTQRTHNLATGYLLKILGDYEVPSDIHFTDLQITPKYTNQAYSVLIRSADGVYFNNFHIHGGILVSPRGSNFENTLASLFFNNGYLDNSISYNLNFEGSATTAYRNIFLTQVYVRGGTSGIGFNTTSKISQFSMHGGKISEQKQHGILINNDKLEDSNIQGVIFYNNNTQRLSDGTDILVRGKGISILGTTHINDNQRVGYVINMGTASYNCLVDNVMAINAKTSAYVSTQSGSTNVVGRVIKP